MVHLPFYAFFWLIQILSPLFSEMSLAVPTSRYSRTSRAQSFPRPCFCFVVPTKKAIYNLTYMTEIGGEEPSSLNGSFISLA